MLLIVVYQLAFLTPGILPDNAIFRNKTREIPNCRIYPLGRPVIWQRLCIRTAALFGGSFWNPSQSPAAFNAARFDAYLATIRSRLRSRAFIDSLAILVLFERESESC